MKTRVMITILVLLASVTGMMGCLDGEITIKGTVQTADDVSGYAYVYAITLVTSGPAKVKNFKFKLENRDDDKVLEGKVDSVDYGGTIQFKNNRGDEKEANIGDTFIIVATGDCSGGKLKVYYNGDKVGEYDL